MDITETGAPRAAESTAAPPSRFSGGGWMTLVALLGAGWGALLSYSAFYLTDDRTAPPAVSRPAEASVDAAAPPATDRARSQVSVPQAKAPQAAASAVPVVPPAPAPSAEAALVAALAPPAAAAPDREPQAQPSATLPALALPIPPVAATPTPRPQALADTPPTESPAVPAPAATPEGVDPSAPDYVGVWGPNAQACGARSLRRGYLPARLTADGAKAGGTTCSFGDRRRSGLAWVVTASCRDASHRWSSQVRLLVDGERLLWSSPKGLSTYVRCKRAT